MNPTKRTDLAAVAKSIVGMDRFERTVELTPTQSALLSLRDDWLPDYVLPHPVYVYEYLCDMQLAERQEYSSAGNTFMRYRRKVAK